MSGSVREWFYLDSIGQKQQKGPFSADILSRMLERGVGVSGDTLIWRAGLEQWVAMQEIEPFRGIVTFQRMQWYYTDTDGVQQGPCLSRMLLHKFKEGEVDGMTLICCEGASAWTPMHDVELFKDAIFKMRADDEAQELAVERTRELEAQSQVYVVDEEGYQRLVDLGARQITDKSRDEVKKSFVADDGVRYMWDEAEQTWIEDDDQEDRDDDDEDDDDDEEGHTQGGPGGNRGSIVLDQTDTSVPDEKKKRKKRKQRRPKKQAANMWVYITGLPADTTLDEIKAHFSKVGLIAISAVDQQPKIKLYLDETGVPKGDCSICYNAEQSVQMAVEVLSGGYLRPSHQVTVTRAEFSIHESHGDEGDVAVAKKQKTISHQQVKVAMSAMNQALSWSEDDDSGAGKFSFLKIVVLEGMFIPEDFEEEAFLGELEEDIAGECGKCGVIEKITVFSGNPRGIVVVKFGTSFSAQQCISMMDGRFFGGRKIRCFFWDQVTNYTVVDEAKEDQLEKKRIEEFGDWLENAQEDLPEEFKLQVEG